jgi:hypothetical protein
MAHAQLTADMPAANIHPPCPLCGSEMMLTRIEPEDPGYETRMFECLSVATRHGSSCRSEF